MKIRVMKTEDIEQALMLWNGAKGVGQSPDDTPENIKRYLERNPLTSFVVEDRQRIVGAIMAGHDGYRGFIHHTAVAEEYRSQGLGARLWEQVQKSLQAERIHKVVLIAFRTNEGANAFWEKQGFHIREDVWYRDLRI